MFLDFVEHSLVAEDTFGVAMMYSRHSGPGRSRENEGHSETGAGLGLWRPGCAPQG